MVQPEDKGKFISYSQVLLLEVPKNYFILGSFSLYYISYDIAGLSDDYINFYANYLVNHRLPMTCNQKM